MQVLFVIALFATIVSAGENTCDGLPMEDLSTCTLNAICGSNKICNLGNCESGCTCGENSVCNMPKCTGKNGGQCICNGTKNCNMPICSGSNCICNTGPCNTADSEVTTFGYSPTPTPEPTHVKKSSSDSVMNAWQAWKKSHPQPKKAQQSKIVYNTKTHQVDAEVSSSIEDAYKAFEQRQKNVNVGLQPIPTNAPYGIDCADGPCGGASMPSENIPVTTGSYGIDCAFGPCGGANFPSENWHQWGMNYGQHVAQQAREMAHRVTEHAMGVQNAAAQTVRHALENIPYLNHETSNGTFYI